MFASGKTNAVANGTANYIEDVFSTYLYTGNGSTQTITNGIDLSTKGGMLWLKRRDAAFDPRIWDTARGRAHSVATDLTDAQTTETASYGVTSFNSDGFSIGPASSTAPNLNAATYASWTFRKQPKFFDVVTWTGDDSANRQISHSLGSVPGCIIVKRTDASATWRVWHQNMVSNPANLYQYQLNLNTTNAVNLTYGEVWGTSNNVTSTTFQVGSLAAVNASGGTYVAYVFAHNAGGFGLTGTDNVISCGSYTGNGSATGPTVTLGYEPQWVLIKRTDSASGGAWALFDNMRGLTVAGSADPVLYPNSSDAEFTGVDILQPLATGFQLTGTNWNTSGGTYIYIAIRRGPMKVPTSGTSVFSPVLRNGTGANANIQSGFPTDLIVFLNTNREWDAMGNYWTDRMRSGLKYLTSTATNAEADWNNVFQNDNGFDTQNGVLVTSDVANGVINHSGTPYINWMFRRAPSFFDEVCYTGGSGAQTVPHNLGVAPELIIIKSRSLAGTTPGWPVYTASGGVTKYLSLNTTDAQTTFAPFWGGTAPTSTNFYLGGYAATNNTGDTYVAYLFATCAGVSKVGSYTGTGTTKQVDCGFTGGARFVLIKRTDSTGAWYVWDTARGIVSGNDPYLLLNSTAAETTGTDYIDTYSAGFEISSTAPAAINASGGTFIFLAIA